MKLRIGLVGLGNAWENRHRPALRALNDRLEVTAICEPVAHRAEIAAGEFKAAQVDGFRALAAATRPVNRAAALPRRIVTGAPW